MSCGNLPEDLVVEILSRIPAKSLVRFKSACRSWWELIDDPYFVAKHHQTRAVITNTGCFFSRYYSDRFSRGTGWCFLHREGESSDVRHEDLHPPCLTLKTVDAAAADGIFYLYAGDEGAGLAADGKFYVYNGETHRIGTYYLWNPSTRESKTVTPHRFSTFAPNLIGLGIDIKTGDVKVLHTYTIRARGGSLMAKASVWTSRDGCWRELDNISPLTGDMCRIQKQLYIKGRCYWYIKDTVEESILCFDIVDEKFQLFPLPATATLNCKYRCSKNIIIELKQSIGFVCFHPQGAKSFDVWLMSHGDPVSWSKYLTLQVPWPTSCNDYCELRLLFTEREVIFADAFDNFYFQNLSTRKTTFFNNKLLIYYSTFIVYNESMVSFKVRNQKRSALERAKVV